MFTTFKQRLILGIFVFVILSIPIGAYVISEQQSKPPDASSKSNSDRSLSLTQTITSAKPSPTPAKLDLSSLSNEINESAAIPTIATTFGPTLEFKITLEGRPLSNQATKLFVGIADGTQTGSPQYLLSFNVDIPASGVFTGLSLAGLTPEQNYKAYLKGPAQIATSSAFTMNTNTSTLNNNTALNLITGDLNEDNVINSADYAISKSLYNTNQNSPNWNENADFNKDGIVNAIDLGIIVKNLGKTGDSGVWQSTPQTGFADRLTPGSTGSPESSGSAKPGGVWIWLPEI